MIKIIIIIFLMIVIYYCWTNKIHIKWKTFFKKGFKPNRGIFGIYCYCGKQGSGKTYSVIEYLDSNKDKKIFANLKSINKTEIPYQYINGFDDLLKLRSEHDVIIFYDEIFTELTKYSKINTDVLDFLSQMRKRRIIFLTTAQEWAEIPLTFRRYCRYQINCRLIRLPILNGILIKNFMDAENMKWSNDDNDFVAPLIENTISHTQKRVANLYDTFEQIGKYASTSTEVLDTSVDQEKADIDFWQEKPDNEWLVQNEEEN